MSLYHEAAEVIDIAKRSGGSIKSIVFSRNNCKSDRKTLFALTTEAAKWSEMLSEVIEKSGVLNAEKQLTPELALLLSHDLLLSKKGIALPSDHGLHAAIGRHGSRLAAELTKLRLRRGFATLDTFRVHLNSEANGVSSLSQHGVQSTYAHPRWVRINTLRTSLEKQLNSTFADYKKTSTSVDIRGGKTLENPIYVDAHIPDLVAVRSEFDITGTRAYKEGRLILQDKASCFPAYLLDPGSLEGDTVDACAAPGNKTTHLAALISSTTTSGEPGSRKRKIFACERDRSRSETLAKMVKLAGADDGVRVIRNQDFLKLDPHSAELSNVTAILLDPSCSGSGIIGRDEATVVIHLPKAAAMAPTGAKGKKRKRNHDDKTSSPLQETSRQDTTEEEVPTTLDSSSEKLQTRLAALSSFQLRLLEHALAFPSARRITYSTCSLYKEENEHVVLNGLLSKVAMERGWRILRRDEQVEGLQRWHRRGDLGAVSEMAQSHAEAGFDVNEIADACMRCEKGGEDGTMGFFVAGFIREESYHVNGNAITSVSRRSAHAHSEVDRDGSEDEWAGFSDEET